MHVEEGSQARDLASHAVVGEQLLQLATKPLTLAVQPLEDLRRQAAQRGKPSGHAQGMAIVRAAVLHPTFALRVQQLHDLAATAERSDGETTTDDLAHGRQVGANS